MQQHRGLRRNRLPFSHGQLNIPPDEILKYHKGNKEYKLPQENEFEFRALDTPVSGKRYVLLVQIGKEGWSCRSLTGVILSGKNDSPKNMVLQTSCRCLRQVDPNDPDETALIWLNEGNAKLLNAQLKQEQNTTIAELNALVKDGGAAEVPRHARTDYLKLPPVAFYQLKVTYQAIQEEESANTGAKLRAIDPERFRTAALVRTGTLEDLSGGNTEIIRQTGAAPANYQTWLFELSKASFGLIALEDLLPYDDALERVFAAMTYEEGGQRFFNDLYDRYAIDSEVRLAFSIRRRLATSAEVVPQDASLLLVDKLSPVKDHDKLYPNAEDSAKILELDASGAPLEPDADALKASYDAMKETLTAQGLGAMVLPFDAFRKQFEVGKMVKHKDRSFHYLPYDFKQSRFELDILQEALCLTDIQERGLELYFNGERGLTEFVISCFACEGGFWKNVGRYTPDFLLIERREGAIHRALILETKGAGYSNDPAFLKKKKYVESEFLQQNNDKFGYARFNYLYLEDSADMAENLSHLSDKVKRFFNDAP